MECNICNQTKTEEEMHKDGRTRTGYSSTCESCFYDEQRARKNGDKRRYRQSQEYKDKYREWQLQRHYKLTLEQFDELLVSQDGGCASCGADNPRWAKGWCVDHDHSCCLTTPTCGKCTRGILCMPCNMSVGMMKESVEDLLSLVEYLTRTRSMV